MQALGDEITRQVEPIEGIAALLVFGSRAAGTERPEGTQWSIATRSRVA